MPQPGNNKPAAPIKCWPAQHKLIPEAEKVTCYHWETSADMLVSAKQCASVCLLYEPLFCPADCGQGTERQDEIKCA